MADTAQQPKHAPVLLHAGGGTQSKAPEERVVTKFSPYVQSFLRRLHVSQNAAAADGLNQSVPSSYEDFEAWFRSPAASALAPPSKHDLSYPISNYYISSSHNTYLSGNQLYGASSGEAYENVLARGCRCLEIDVWDGEDDSSSVSSPDLEKDDTKHTGGSTLSRFKHLVKEKALHKKTEHVSQADSDDHAEKLPAPWTSSVSWTSQSQAYKSEPRVMHGHTLTKDVPFRTVCHAIRDSAFEATSLPIIVSLEVHCSMDQQETMVEILHHVFQDHLVPRSNKDEIHSLPSPDDLRNKILIKVKYAPNTETGETNDPLDHVQSDETTLPNGQTSSPEQKRKAAKILDKLSALGVYTRAYSFKRFDQPEAKIPTHVFSLSEAKVEDIHADPQHGHALFEHNRNFLMRVFPSGLRVNSSNVEPCFLWRQGAQMVALNWQTLDKSMMLNEGMFAGEEGWVLKPEGFRGTSVTHKNVQTPVSSPKRCLLDLEIELIAAQDLPLPLDKDISYLSKMKPYVKMQLHVDTHGPPGQTSGSISSSHSRRTSRYIHHLHSQAADIDGDSDEEARKLKRRSRSGKSAEADFGGETMQWTGIPDVVDELSFLRLKVHDDRALGKDDLIAWACIKLSRLQQGYRFIHLLDPNGKSCLGVLLVRIKKELQTH